MPLYWDDEYQPTGTRAAKKTTSFFDSITPPKIQTPTASTAPTWNTAGYYDDGLGHYSNNGGASWDYRPTPAGPAYNGAPTSTETPNLSSTYPAPFTDTRPWVANDSGGGHTWDQPGGNVWLPPERPGGQGIWYDLKVDQYYNDNTNIW